MPTTEERVRKVVARQLGLHGPEEASVSMDLVADLGADSLDIAELCFDLEREFNTDLPSQAFNTVATVQDLIDLVNEELRLKAA